MNLQSALLVGAAGFLGTLARYISATALASYSTSQGLPTFFVNAVGSFLIGWVYGLGLQKFDQQTVTILTVGFLGGFTTFSAFSMDTFLFLKEGRWLYGVTYVFVMVLSCLAATAFGFWASRY